MKLVTIDFETYWSKDHTLSKLNPIVYCMSPETELISCAIKVNAEPTQVVFGEPQVKKALAAIDWSDAVAIAHNMSGFDSMLLAWRCGVSPKMWACTLSMARPHHAMTTGLSLGKLVEHYEIGHKDNSALMNTKGRHLKDFTPEEIEAMRGYNAADTDQCYQLFRILLKKTPVYEMKLIDQSIRQLVEPWFEADTDLLETSLAEERWRKKQTLIDLDRMLGGTEIDPDKAADEVAKMLGSSPKFAAFLQERGVEPPMKPSPTNPEKETHALAKTDEAFIALQEHDDPVVAAAAAARLGVKSTILESRIGKFLEASEAVGGRMPVPVNYYGAHTGRNTGGFKMNMLNLPRVSGKPTDALRKSLRAPKGYKVVVADLSGIELRMNMFLWRVGYAMEMFRADPAKADLYRATASEYFGVLPADVSKVQRQMGKYLQLLCGYGGSYVPFIKSAKVQGGLDLTIEEGKAGVTAYRRQHPEIVRGWEICKESLEYIAGGGSVAIDPWGLCYAERGQIHTPKGAVRYPELRREMNAHGKNEWVFGVGRHTSRVYGGLIDENLVQHLSRFVLTDAKLEFIKTTGFPVVLDVYDELVSVVPEKHAESALDEMQRIMRKSPAWFPELVLWSEGSTADSYGEAKG